MAAALTLMAKQRGDVDFGQQVLFYPVTDASFDTASYHQFAEGYFLRRDAMQWFWDQYTTDPAERARDHRLARCAPPPRSSPGCRRRWSSTARPTCCATRARRTRGKLRAAGVAVTAARYGGVIHDFMMLNALRETHAAGAAIAQAITFLKGALA